jgi:hypothetical protein
MANKLREVDEELEEAICEHAEFWGPNADNPSLETGVVSYGKLVSIKNLLNLDASNF